MKLKEKERKARETEREKEKNANEIGNKQKLQEGKLKKIRK